MSLQEVDVDDLMPANPQYCAPASYRLGNSIPSSGDAVHPIGVHDKFGIVVCVKESFELMLHSADRTHGIIRHKALVLWSDRVEPEARELTLEEASDLYCAGKVSKQWFDSFVKAMP